MEAKSDVINSVKQKNTTLINSNSSCNYPNTLNKTKLKKVLIYIKKNLDCEISLNDLALEVNLSKFHFVRLFKNSTGRSPYQFIIENRIIYAKYLLAKTKTPLVEIALNCGWSNQSHFTTAFKKEVGITPKIYRLWLKS